MASKQFLDPMTLLRLVPFIGATLTISKTNSQFNLLTLLNHPDIQTQANPLLPHYFTLLSPRLVRSLLTTIMPTVTLSLINAYAYPCISGAWYKAGAFAALLHFCFLPFVNMAETGVRVNHPARDANKALADWTWYVGARGVTADLLAWVCLGIAAVRGISG